MGVTTVVLYFYNIEVVLVEINLSTTVQLITIVTFVAGVLNYTIIKPLRESITSLEKTIAKMDNNFQAQVNTNNEMKKDIVIVDQSVKSAHHRIDEHGKRLDRLERGA